MPIWGICYIILRRFKAKIFQQYFSHLKVVAFNLKKSLMRELISTVLLSLAFLLIVVSAMGPMYGKKEQEVKQVGIDIVMALDISKSMDAEDIKPSRLRRAKLELKEFIENLKGDRIGLITFAGKTVRNSPLTVDYFALKMFLEEIDTDMIRYQGTDLRGAILKGLESFSDRNAKGRALIIISDGENHDQSLAGAIDKAKEMNVRIYTVGAGTIEGAPIPVNGKGFKRRGNGEVIVSKLMPNMLQQLAIKTSGRYYSSSNQGYKLEEVYQRINEDIEKVTISNRQSENMINRYQIPLFLGLLLLVIEYIFLRRGNIILGLIICLFPIQGFSGWFDDSFSNYYDEKKYSESEALVKQKAIKSQSVNDLYNLGASYYKQGKLDDAVAIFKQVKKDSQKINKVKGGFGLGNSFFKKSDFVNAINAYENVLKVSPDDEDTKKNLELAKKMLAQQKKSQQDNDQSNQKEGDQKNQQEKDDSLDNEENNQKGKNEQKQDNEKKQQQNRNDNQNNNDKSNNGNQQSGDENKDQSSENQSDSEKQKNGRSDLEKKEAKQNSQQRKDDKKEASESFQDQKSEESKNQGEKKESFRSKMLLNQIEDSRENYQKNMQRREPRFNSGGENDW